MSQNFFDLGKPDDLQPLSLTAVGICYWIFFHALFYDHPMLNMLHPILSFFLVGMIIPGILGYILDKIGILKNYFMVWFVTLSCLFCIIGTLGLQAYEILWGSFLAPKR